jgi:tetratricopeptide (TPR) repeat protein
MADKKKTSTSGIVPAAKGTETRMSKPSTPKTTKNEAPQTAPSGRAGAATGAQPFDAAKQLAVFESAMKLFHARKFKEARELFDQAAGGPERDVAHRARLHASMCERRLQQAPVSLGSAEDYYNYGVALLNTRNVVEARTHLEKALQIAPGSDHIHYALALAQALGGDLANAHENLKRAIELEPRNRLIARQDVDFAALANQPPLDALIYPEKKIW